MKKIIVSDSFCDFIDIILENKEIEISLLTTFDPN